MQTLTIKFLYKQPKRLRSNQKQQQQQQQQQEEGLILAV